MKDLSFLIVDRHGVPVLLLRSHDVSKMHVVYFEEKKNLTLLPKDQCYNGFDLCTATSALHDVTRSFGSGLVYYDPIEKENYLLGIFSSFSYLTNTKEYLENYVSTNGNLVDWVEAHTSDDTVIVLLLQLK